MSALKILLPCAPTFALATVLLLSGCENRKKQCEKLYQKIAACAPADRKPSKRARLDFIAMCQKEYDGANVKRTRRCVSKHSGCGALRKCLVKKLKLDPGPDAGSY